MSPGSVLGKARPVRFQEAESERARALRPSEARNRRHASRRYRRAAAAAAAKRRSRHRSSCLSGGGEQLHPAQLSLGAAILLSRARGASHLHHCSCVVVTAPLFLFRRSEEKRKVDRLALTHSLGGAAAIGAFSTRCAPVASPHPYRSRRVFIILRAQFVEKRAGRLLENTLP